MKKLLLLTIIMILVNMAQAKTNGPVLLEKLTPPELNKRQTLQKRAFTWIKGQWKIVNDKYEWNSGHWAEKKSRLRICRW